MEITKQRSLPSDAKPPPTSRAPGAAWGDGEGGREPEPVKGLGGGGLGGGEDMDFELAITGPAFGNLIALHRAGVRAPLECVTKLGRVFARMSPEQKQALVETYGDGEYLC